jgi:site-specific DNA-cytosine methylase
MDQLTFLSEEPLVSPSQSQDLEKDWTMNVVTYRSNSLNLLNENAHDGWFGRTSPASCHSNGGKDFGSFLGALGEIGYGFAYRVLDAQYFGVAQRRRRVFVVGYLGDWRRAAAVLFERESLRGNPAPSREKGEKPAPTLTAGPPFSRTGNDRVECDAYVSQIVGPLTRASNAGGTVTHQDISAQHLVTARMRPECDAYDTRSYGNH